MASAKSWNVLPKTLLLSLLMIFLGISAATSGLNKAETTDLSDQNDVRKTILPLSQLNEPGFQEGSIFTDTTLSSGIITTPAPSLTTVLCRAGERDSTANWVMEEHLTKPHPRSPAPSVRVAQQ